MGMTAQGLRIEVADRLVGAAVMTLLLLLLV